MKIPFSAAADSCPIGGCGSLSPSGSHSWAVFACFNDGALAFANPSYRFGLCCSPPFPISLNTNKQGAARARARGGGGGRSGASRGAFTREEEVEEEEVVGGEASAPC